MVERVTSTMEQTPALAILEDLVPNGIRFGASYLVEFGPDSPWYETSLTIAASGLRNGARTEYHTYMHPPHEVRESLTKLGLNVKELERKDQLRILDTYDVMTGLAHPETPEGMRSKGREAYEHQSFDLNHWSSKVVNIIREGVVEDEKQWLQIHNDGSVTIDPDTKPRELGIGGWLKGPKKSR